MITTRFSYNTFTVYDDLAVIGRITLWGPGFSWIGWELWAPYRNRGIISMLVPQILEHVTMPKIEAHIRNNNFASQRVAQKCGFTFEGQLDDWTQKWTISPSASPITF